MMILECVVFVMKPRHYRMLFSPFVTTTAVWIRTFNDGYESNVLDVERIIVVLGIVFLY